MRSGGQPGLYLSGGSSSIPDETSSGFCSSGQKVMSFGGSAVDMTWTGCFPVLSHPLSGWSYASSLEAEIFCCFLLFARVSRDVGLGAMVWAGLCRARLGGLLLLVLGCALRAARSLRVDGFVSPIRAVSFVRVAPSRIKSQWRGGLFHPCLVLLGGWRVGRIVSPPHHIPGNLLTSR